jgi:serine/threonine-protein kinase
MATEVDDRVGSLVDERYKILAPMASGSMGAVYKAERVPVGKLVAIKFLHASYANDPEFLARFERETRVMSKLAHPNCVSVVDFGVWAGAPYLVMEYVAGRTLRAIIDGGPLPAARALGIARQLAAGLAHAHAQGITHRDIKPANIMISDEIGAGEHVRILDFGLARLRGMGGRDATQANVVVGTPNYMAPEQTVGGGVIDARTDLYAVGVVLFEMIAGERPFKAEDTLTLLGMHRAAPIPHLADRVPPGVEVPVGLSAVIERAMAKAPDDRFATAIALAEALDALALRRSSETPKLPSGRHDLDPTAVAPLVHDVDRSAVATSISRAQRGSHPRLESSEPPRRMGRRAIAAIALLVLGAGGYTAYALYDRATPTAAGGSSLAGGSDVEEGAGSAADDSREKRGSGGEPAASPARDAVGTPNAGETASASGAPGSASGAPGSASAALGSASAAPSSASAAPGSASAPGSAGSSAGAAEPAAGAEGELARGGSASAGRGSGGDGTPDAVAATDPAPASGAGAPDDEDDDAPKTQADVERRVPPAAPALATTLPAAVALIREGKRDLALTSLSALQKKQTRNAYIPFLLGNLYYDKRWWSVALEHYRVAIALDGGYRRNATLVRNVIRMLASKKTDRQAEAFLRRTIGRAAHPHLQEAARIEPNPTVRRYAAALARQIR